MRTNAADGSLSLGGKALGRYMGVSGLSELVVVGERSAIPVPDGLSLRSVCPVGCGVTTGFGAAVITGAVRWGESVAGFGCGGVGLSAIQGARIAGAAGIVAVDPNRQRLSLAGELGAAGVRRPGVGGRAVVAGLPSYTEEIRVPMISLLLDKSLHGSIHGSADPARDFPELFGLAQRGELRLEEMVGPGYPLEKVNDAFEALAGGRAVRPRVVFEVGS
jgi:Zn-dependent alcohol dehydrogenase